MSESPIRGSSASEEQSIRRADDTTGVRNKPKVNIWIIGGDPASYEHQFSAFGNPILVTAWHDHARSPAAVVEQLINSSSQDRLGIGHFASTAHIAFAVATWFTLHTECQLIFANGEGGLAAQRIDKMSLIKMIELARAEHKAKKTRP